jgi:hypothetical protein
VWKHKLLFVETPDAMETSVALKNFREVSDTRLSLLSLLEASADTCRRATMVEEQSCFPSLEERCPRESISISEPIADRISCHDWS